MILQPVYDIEGLDGRLVHSDNWWLDDEEDVSRDVIPRGGWALGTAPSAEAECYDHSS